QRSARAATAQAGAAACARNRHFPDSAARESIAGAPALAGGFSGRSPAIVAGARRSFDVLDFRTETGSAGLGVDATEAESMRSALARLTDAHRRMLDQLPTGVAMFDAGQKLTFYNTAYAALRNIDPAYLDQRPTD